MAKCQWLFPRPQGPRTCTAQPSPTWKPPQAFLDCVSAETVWRSPGCSVMSYRVSPEKDPLRGQREQGGELRKEGSFRDRLGDIKDCREPSCQGVREGAERRRVRAEPQLLAPRRSQEGARQNLGDNQILTFWLFARGLEK